MKAIKFRTEERYEFYSEDEKEFLGYALVTYTDPLMSVTISGVDGNTIYESDGFTEDEYNEASDFQKTFLDALNLL